MELVHKNEIFLFQLQGRLDQQGGLQLKQQIQSIEAERCNLWLIDLVQIDFIDSAGLSALINVQQVANHSCCRLVLCNVCPAVRLVLEITRLDQVFEIFDSSTEARETLAQPLEVMPAVDPVWVAA